RQGKAGGDRKQDLPTRLRQSGDDGVDAKFPSGKRYIGYLRLPQLSRNRIRESKKGQGRYLCSRRASEGGVTRKLQLPGLYHTSRFCLPFPFFLFQVQTHHASTIT